MASAAAAAAAIVAGAGCCFCDDQQDDAAGTGPQASRADVQDLLTGLQTHFVQRLGLLDAGSELGSPSFRQVSWDRDAGAHGGGHRYEADATGGDDVFNRASVNVSGVHYEDVKAARIDSATALSVILHPRNPHAPSMHFHISYMEPRGASPYWRMIADLNPAIEDAASTAAFEEAVGGAMPGPLYRDATVFGDKYFNIPTLGRTRGVSHMFIAKLDPGVEMPAAECMDLAKGLAERTIRVYCDLVQKALRAHPEDSITQIDRDAQLAYHTLYLFQVLTLDRGTTHGLLAHSENDVGTLGSLPSAVDGALLASWKAKLKPPQDLLLQRILDALPARGEGVSKITPAVRTQLAAALRQFYREDMKRVRLQADMDMRWWAASVPKRVAEARVRSLSTSDILAELAKRSSQKK